MDYVLDFETRSRVDLIAQGLDNYVACPDFKVLLAVLKCRDTDERVTASGYGDVSLTIRDALEPVLLNPKARIIAHNAMFEYVVCCQLARDWGIPEPKLQRFHCTAFRGSVFGMPSGLDLLATLWLGEGKLAQGLDLIRLFSIPQKDGDWRYPEDEPVQWAKFRYYCERDVELTDALWDAYPRLSDEQERELRQYWLLTSHMNLRGFRIDRAVVQSVLKDIELIKSDAVAITESVTKGFVRKPTERKAFMQWLISEGIPASSLTSDRVMEWIRDPGTQDDIKRLLWARLDASKSTFGKYIAFNRFVSADGRIRHSFKPAGAHTLRLSGVGVQPQNIAYDKEGEFPSAPKMLKAYVEHDWPDDWNRAKALIAMTRAVIMAERDKTFYIVDYASIEARLQVWLANIEWAIRAYERQEDLYKPMAATIFAKTVEEVTKAERNQYGKVTVLGAGYGMGPTKFSAQNNLPVHIAKTCIYAYRNRYAPVKLLWSVLEDAMRACIIYKKPAVAQMEPNAHGRVAPRVRFEYVELAGAPYVKCTPPGGRPLWYRKPRLGEDGRIHHEKVTKNATFETSIWGGTILENCIAGGTPVLTDSGWKAIELVLTNDKVWDGISWVSHTGLLSKGWQRVISAYGAAMTPDHKVLTNAGWAPAKSEKYDRANVRLPDGYSAPFCTPTSRQSGPEHTRETVLAPVYDLRDCGPNHRFTIWAGSAPLLVHNCCQNMAGAIISQGAANLAAIGVEAVMQIHDELVCEIDDDIDMAELDACMTSVTGFEGLPIDVESRLSKRFGK